MIKEEIDWKDFVEGSEFLKFYFFVRMYEYIDKWKEEFEEFKKEIDFIIFIFFKYNVEVMVVNVNKVMGI